MTVYPGTQKITFGGLGGPDSEYLSKLRAAEAQAAYIDMGVQGVADEGTGRAFMIPRRDPMMGNVNYTVGDMQQGINSNFSAQQSNYNAPLENPDRQTGSMTYATSSTNDPQVDPEELDTSALTARIEKMACNGRLNLNSSSVYGI